MKKKIILLVAFAVVVGVFFIVKNSSQSNLLKHLGQIQEKGHCDKN